MLDTTDSPIPAPPIRALSEPNSLTEDDTRVFAYETSPTRSRINLLRDTLEYLHTILVFPQRHSNIETARTFFESEIRPLITCLNEIAEQTPDAYNQRTAINLPPILQPVRIPLTRIAAYKVLTAHPVVALRKLENLIVERLTEFQRSQEEALVCIAADTFNSSATYFLARKSNGKTQRQLTEALEKIRTKAATRIKNVKQLHSLIRAFADETRIELTSDGQRSEADDLDSIISKLFEPLSTDGAMTGESPLEGYQAIAICLESVKANEKEAQDIAVQVANQRIKIILDKFVRPILSSQGIEPEAGKDIPHHAAKHVFQVPVCIVNTHYILHVAYKLTDHTNPSSCQVYLENIVTVKGSRKAHAQITSLLSAVVNQNLRTNPHLLGDIKTGLENASTIEDTERELRALNRSLLKPALVFAGVIGLAGLLGIGRQHYLTVKNSPASTSNHRTAPQKPDPHHTAVTHTPTAAPVLNTPSLPPAPIPAHANVVETQVVELASITIPDERCANAEWALAQTLRIAERSTQTTRNAVTPILAANSIPRAAHLLAHRGDSLVTRARRSAILERPGDNDSAIRINTFRARGGFHTNPGDGFKLVESVAPGTQVRTLQFVHVANNVELYRVDLSTSPSSSDVAQTTSTTVSAAPFVRVANSPVISATFDVGDIDPIADLTAIDSKCRASSTVSLPQAPSPKHVPFGLTKALSTKPIVTQRNINNDHDNKYWDPNGQIYQTFMQPTVETRYIDQDSWKHRIYMQSVKANMWMQSSYVTIKNALGKVKRWFSRTN